MQFHCGLQGMRTFQKIFFFFSSAGRTFPTHPYFSVQLGPGQLSLFNLLKAYSLLDKEVGYCQGISFVAGVLLLHMSEEQAFEMLKFLMYDLGFRKQYRPDMMSLQVRHLCFPRKVLDYYQKSWPSSQLLQFRFKEMESHCLRAWMNTGACFSSLSVGFAI